MEFHAAMAQLAHCPACNCEVALPEQSLASDAPDVWVQCPECDEVFAASDANRHEVKQAKAVAPPASVGIERGEPKETPAIDESVPAKSKLASPTLSSFLSSDRTPDDEAVDEPAAEEKNDEKAEAPTLAEFESLDDLIRRSSALAGIDPPEAAPVQGATDDQRETVDFPSAASVDAADDSHDELDADEPSPAADRMRPTLSELFRGATPTADPDDSGTYDPVAEADDTDERSAASPAEEEFESPAEDPLRGLDGVPGPASFESTLRDLDDSASDDTEVAASVSDAPSFDFEVGGSHDLESSRSLRAAMGFGYDEPLEVEPPEDRPSFATIETNDDQHESPELQISGADAPRGVVAARKRSGAMSVVRTMAGVAGGGVVGIVAGYLLLLWIFHFIGRTDEPLALAKYYPDVVKPSTFQDAPSTSAVPSSTDMLAGDANDSADSTDELTPMEDSSVEAASFTDEMPDFGDETQPAEEAVAPLPPVVVAGAPHYTAAELQHWTDVGQQASNGLLAGSFDDAAARPVKGGSYANIAQLADALTFGEGAADVSWKHHARQVFPPLFETEQARREISLIAGYWLTSSKRGHGGIFFCGTPDQGRQKGSVAEYEFTLPSGQQLTVLTPRALTDSVTSSPSVAVVGSVIDNPASRVEGYTGDAERAIWSPYAFGVGE